MSSSSESLGSFFLTADLNCTFKVDKHAGIEKNNLVLHQVNDAAILKQLVNIK